MARHNERYELPPDPIQERERMPIVPESMDDGSGTQRVHHYRGPHFNYQQYETDEAGSSPSTSLTKYVSNYHPGTEARHDFEENFVVKDKKKYNDLWAAILFWIVFAGFVAISIYSIYGLASTRSYNGGSIYDGTNTVTLSTHTIILFSFVLAVSVLISYLYVLTAYVFPMALIWITGILNVILGLASGIFMCYEGYYAGGIPALIFTLIGVAFFMAWTKRIPFSAVMLRLSIEVSKKHGHVLLVSFLGGLTAAVFAIWWSVTMVAIYNRFQPGTTDNPNPLCRTHGGCSVGAVAGLMIYIVCAGYWIPEVIKNVIHTTTCGVYGSWYFCSKAFPRRVTRGALKRAMTTSFGSITLGSLVVAIINALKTICSLAGADAESDGNIVASAFFWIIGYFLSVLSWAAEFANRYAFAHIALYGKPFFEAAKDTWTAIKDRGIDLLINDCLVGPVLSLGGMLVGILAAFLAYLFLVFTHPAYNKEGAYTVGVVAFAFLIGFQICNVFTTPISSGIDTIFVASSWAPQVIMRDHPEEYRQLVEAYPKVATAIHTGPAIRRAIRPIPTRA